MKKLLFISIICFISWMAGAQQVIELKKSTLNKVVIKLMFRNGAICDPIGKEGLTALTSSLVTEGGTDIYTRSQIDEIKFPMAADYGVSVDKEVSTFTFQVPADFLQQFYPVIKGLILNPSFTQADFDRVKSGMQVYVDQELRESSDEDYSKLALENILFGGTNYGHIKQGTSQSLKGLTLDDVKNHYKNFYTANNLTIGIAGNYSDAFLKQLKADLSVKSKDIKPVIPVPGKASMPNGIQVEIISKKNAPGSAIFTGEPLAITRRDNDFAALMVANSWLGEHRKSYSRLYQKIREDRSMNYGDYTYIEWYEGGGYNMLPQPNVPRSSNYFSIWIRPVQVAESLKKQYPELSDIKIGHAQFALRMAIREIDLIVQNGMSQQDFEATRTFLRSYIKLYTQTPEEELGFLMDSYFYGRKDYIKEMDALLAKLTLDDVNKAIRKYLQTQNMFVTIITDDSEADALAESLRTNAPSPMSYSNLVKEGLPKEILDEDNAVSTYKLNVKDVKIVDSDSMFVK
jgi:zinc protease